MVNKDIPDEVKKFIHKYIESLTQLEVLLFLFNNQPGSFNAQIIAQEMRTNPESVAVSLSDLASFDFLKADNSEKSMYEYNQRNKDDRNIRQLENAYLNYRHTLITLIYSKPADNARSFSDAFKLKKDDDNG